LLLLAVWIGYALLATPGTTTIALAGGKGTLTVPRSLEGWQVAPGTDDMLATGKTRLGLMQLQVQQTKVPVGGDLAAYIAERQALDWKLTHDYQVRLKGELRPFGAYRVPVARAVYDGTLLGLKVRMVQYDAYMRSDWRYVRVGFTFPEFLDDFLTPDQEYIALNVKLTD
jgi:hypothetical protein